MSLDFRDRLRPASYVSPSGIEIEFETDTLTKKGGKKTSTHEIVDSDESISQDQGNKTDVFPFNIYFTNDEFDESLKEFEALLRERYSIDTPGILRHPLWGDITVMPTSWEPTIELISSVGVGKMTIEFIQMFPRKYPESAFDNSDLVSANLDNMSLIETIMETSSDVLGKIKDVIGAISDAADFLNKVEEEFEAIQNELNAMIDEVGGSILDIMMTTQRLMRLPSRVADSTMNKINTYKSMCDNIISEIIDKKESNPQNLRNNAKLVQAFAGFAVGCLAESALFTTFETKSDTISAISAINEALENYNLALSNSRTDGKIENEYSGDHNFQLLLFDSVSRVNDSLIKNSFSLKSEKRFKLKNKSDPILLCFENYGNSSEETIEYFINTNNIKNDEFIEIPVGREVVFYV